MVDGFLLLAQSAFAIIGSLVDFGFDGISAQGLILCSLYETFGFLLQLSVCQPVPGVVTVHFSLDVFEVLAMQRFTLPSFFSGYYYYYYYYYYYCYYYFYYYYYYPYCYCY